MKAKNLRIGNIVTHKISGISKVTQVGSSIHPEYVAGRSLEGVYWVKSYLPVEITEQWLIDFGFRKDEELNYRWYIDDWLAYDLDDNCIRISDSWEFGKRKYVHELQNLYFAITGTELEMKVQRRTRS
jgi:hypothetical protein